MIESLNIPVQDISAVVKFKNNNVGRISLLLNVSPFNKLVLQEIKFKLDTGADFTTVDMDDLIKILGFPRELLLSCPYHGSTVTAVAENQTFKLQYLDDVEILIDNISLRKRRVYFSSEHRVRNLLGSDILKYFDMDIRRSTGADTAAGYVKFNLRGDIAENIRLGTERDIGVLEDIHSNTQQTKKD